MKHNTKAVNRTRLRQEDLFTDVGGDVPVQGQGSLEKASRLINRGYGKEIADVELRAEFIASKTFRTRDTTLDGKPTCTPLFRAFVDKVAILIRISATMPAETD